MKLLALDTSADACSVALLIGDELISRYQIAPRQHAELVLPMCHELLAAAGIGLTQLDALVLARGPGAFTGLRIATAVVQGLALGADRPVVTVSSLVAVAQRAWREHGAHKVLAGFDARLQEVYWLACQLDDCGMMQAVAEEQVCLPQQIALPSGDDWFGAGSAWSYYAAELESLLGQQCRRWQGDCLPHAQDVVHLGQAGFNRGELLSAAQVAPVYLRDNVAVKPTRQSTGKSIGRKA